MTDASADQGERLWAQRLADASVEVLGRFASASNAALLVLLKSDGGSAEDLKHFDDLDQLVANTADPRLRQLAVFKPRDGEAPLWDFQQGTLYRREVAAFEVSEALGWGLVPATVVFDHPQFGPGSLQRFVPHDPSHHWFHLREHGDAAVSWQLSRMVAFDIVIDNADRKAGHVLLEQARADGDRVTGLIRLVDHGVSFHVDRKLRTVAWDLAGHPVPDDALDDLASVLSEFDLHVRPRLTRLLDSDEIDRTAARIDALLTERMFPQPAGPRAVPWPPL
ncbi:MAG: SCO1664 family protein [Nitriliruptoraceae bacterium]